MLVCETIYGREQGGRVIAMVERCTGAPCPCKQGMPCPLMPVESAELADDTPGD